MVTGSEKYERILEDLEKKNRERENIQVDEEMVKIVIFSLGERNFAFYGSVSKSILTYEPVTSVPGSPPFLSGIINVRGDIESVINLHKILGIPEKKADDKTRIIIAGNEKIRSGILVDAVHDVVDIPVRNISPPVSTLDEKTLDIVEGEIEYMGGMAVLLNLDKVFGQLGL